MPADRIAAVEGFQRLDWSFGRIGFVQCEIEGACRGVPASIAEEAQVLGTPPGMQLRPETQLQLALS